MKGHSNVAWRSRSPEILLREVAELSQRARSGASHRGSCGPEPGEKNFSSPKTIRNPKEKMALEDDVPYQNGKFMSPVFLE